MSGRTYLILIMTIIAFLAVLNTMVPHNPAPVTRPDITVSLTVTDQGCILSTSSMVTFTVPHNHLAGTAYLIQTGTHTYQAWTTLPAYPRYNVAVHGVSALWIWYTKAQLTGHHARFACTGDPN